MERLPHGDAAADGAMNYGSLESRNWNVYDLMLALLLMVAEGPWRSGVTY